MFDPTLVKIYYKISLIIINAMKLYNVLGYNTLPIAFVR